MKSWTEEEDFRLLNAHKRGLMNKQIAYQLGRTERAIESRLAKLKITRLKYPVQLNIRITEETNTRIKNLLVGTGKTRTAFIRELIDENLPSV